MHVTVCVVHKSCNVMLVLLRLFNGFVIWYAAAAAAVCVWSRLPLDSSHTCRPSGLLMVSAMLILAVKVWLCGMTHL